MRICATRSHRDLIPSRPETRSRSSGPQATSARGDTLQSFVDHLYLSQDENVDNGDRFLGEVRRDDALVAGSSSPGSLVVQLPPDVSGDWFLLVQVDGSDQVPESSSESNNVDAAPLSVSLAPYADLIVTEVAGPSTTIGDPAEATISWTVRNVGTGAGQTPRWTDRVIASTDAVLGNGDDRIIAEFVHEGELGVNQAYSRQESILLPAQVQGRFHLFVQTDAAQEVFRKQPRGE